MTAKVTVTYPVSTEDMPLVQFMAGNAPGTGPPGTGASPDGAIQSYNNGVVTGAPLIDSTGRTWTIQATTALTTANGSPNVFVNSVNTKYGYSDPTLAPASIYAAGGVIYMMTVIGISKTLTSGTWYNGGPGIPPPGGTTPPVLPALPTPNPIAPGSSGTVINCGQGQPIATLSAALATAKAGDTIKVTPGAITYTDVLHAISVPLLIDLGGNTWDGTGQDANLPFSGAGFFVIADGADTILQNGTVTGVGMSKSTGDNTSAIRVETAYATLKNLTLHGNQTGIGTGDPNSVIEADGCNIFNNGLTANTGGSLTHNIYVNSRRLTLTNTNSTASVEGYAVKSRGPELIVNGGTFSSSPNAKPFDLPNGTTVPFLMTGATVLKGAADGDHGILSYGEEGASNGLAGGTISGGTIAALCQNPIITGAGGTVTLSGVALTGNPITGQGVTVVIK